jgi:hypothetical protein
MSYERTIGNTNNQDYINSVLDKLCAKVYLHSKDDNMIGKTITFKAKYSSFVIKQKSRTIDSFLVDELTKEESRERFYSLSRLNLSENNYIQVMGEYNRTERDKSSGIIDKNDEYDGFGGISRKEKKGEKNSSDEVSSADKIQLMEKLLGKKPSWLYQFQTIVKELFQEEYKRALREDTPPLGSNIIQLRQVGVRLSSLQPADGNLKGKFDGGNFFNLKNQINPNNQINQINQNNNNEENTPSHLHQITKKVTSGSHTTASNNEKQFKPFIGKTITQNSGSLFDQFQNSQNDQNKPPSEIKTKIGKWLQKPAGKGGDTNGFIEETNGDGHKDFPHPPQGQTSRIQPINSLFDEFSDSNNGFSKVKAVVGNKMVQIENKNSLRNMLVGKKNQNTQKNTQKGVSSDDDLVCIDISPLSRNYPARIGNGKNLSPHIDNIEGNKAKIATNWKNSAQNFLVNFNHLKQPPENSTTLMSKNILNSFRNKSKIEVVTILDDSDDDNDLDSNDDVIDLDETKDPNVVSDSLNNSSILVKRILTLETGNDLGPNHTHKRYRLNSSYNIDNNSPIISQTDSSDTIDESPVVIHESEIQIPADANELDSFISKTLSISTKGLLPPISDLIDGLSDDDNFGEDPFDFDQSDDDDGDDGDDKRYELDQNLSQDMIYYEDNKDTEGTRDDDDDVMPSNCMIDNNIENDITQDNNNLDDGVGSVGTANIDGPNWIKSPHFKAFLQSQSVLDNPQIAKIISINTTDLFSIINPNITHTEGGKH